MRTGRDAHNCRAREEYDRIKREMSVRGGNTPRGHFHPDNIIIVILRRAEHKKRSALLLRNSR